MEYLDAEPVESVATELERSGRGGFAAVVLGVAGLAALVFGLIALGGSAESPPEEPAEPVGTSIAPAPQGVIETADGVVQLSSIVDPATVGELPVRFEAVSSTLVRTARFQPPADGGWYFGGASGVRRTTDLDESVEIPVVVDGVNLLAGATEIAGAGSGDSAVVVVRRADSALDLFDCSLPSETMTVARTDDGGATWTSTDVVSQPDDEFAGLAFVRGDIDVALTASSTMVMWQPRYFLALRCVLEGTEFVDEDIAAVTAGGLTLADTTGRGGELLTWADVGVDVAVYARLTDSSAIPESTFALISGGEVASVDRRVGWSLRSADEAFVVGGLDGDQRVTLEAGWEPLPSQYVVIGLGSGGDVEVLDQADRRLLSFDGGRTFVDTGLGPNLTVQDVVRVGDEWYASVVYAEPFVRRAVFEHEGHLVELRVRIEETLGDRGSVGATVSDPDGVVLIDVDDPIGEDSFPDWLVVDDPEITQFLVDGEVVLAVPDAVINDAWVEGLSTGRPDVPVPLVSHRSADGTWTHQLLSDVLGLGDDAFVTGWFTAGGRPGFVASEGPGRSVHFADG